MTTGQSKPTRSNAARRRLALGLGAAIVSLACFAIFFAQRHNRTRMAELGCSAHCCANAPAKSCKAYYFSGHYRAVMDQIRAAAPSDAQLAHGMRAVDIGAGYGMVTFGASRRVGPSGRIYATELDPSLAALLRKKVAAEQVKNIQVISVSRPRELGLPAEAKGQLDAAFMINSVAFSRDGDREADLAYLRQLRTFLRPSARVYYHTDWLDAHLLPRDDLVRLFADAGFSQSARDVPWPSGVPQHSCMCPGQYGMHGDNAPESEPVTIRRGYILVFGGSSAAESD